MDSGYWLFKLFNSIKEEHEVDFAELELRSLLGPVERIRNFSDVLEGTPLSHFTTDQVRIQDILAYEPCYGRFQGFMAKPQRLPNLERLTRRLAYTREIIGVIGESELSTLKERLPRRRAGRGFASYHAGGLVLLRLVTNQYYLEKSAYVSKLSRNESEIEENIQTLMEYPFQQNYRIPASATMSVGKRLEDYFTIREEGSLYLGHMLHPYKGKFHPKMVRSLLNYVMPGDDGVAMDNFAGSGTLLLEASLMGLENEGVEINPLSVLMSTVKSHSLHMSPKKLQGGILAFLRELSTSLSEFQTVNSGDTLLVQPKFDLSEVDQRITTIPKSVRESFTSPKVLQKFIIADQTIEKLPFDKEICFFLRLGLSGTISDLARRTSQDFLDVISARLSWMYRRVYLFAELNKYLHISPGGSRTLVGDTRDMRVASTLEGRKEAIPDNSVDAIVNSPPYSTALDYVKNDLPQLTILGLVKGLDQVERDMIGNPNLRYYSRELSNETEGESPEIQGIPQEGKTAIRQLNQNGREREAVRVYKFFKDMRLTLLAMKRVLRPGGRAVIIIGNNHYKLDGSYVEIKNDEVIASIAEEIGFRKDETLPIPNPFSQEGEELVQTRGGIRRRLEKTMTGMIRYETVLVLEKPSS